MYTSESFTIAAGTWIKKVSRFIFMFILNNTFGSLPITVRKP